MLLKTASVQLRKGRTSEPLSQRVASVEPQRLSTVAPVWDVASTCPHPGTEVVIVSCHHSRDVSRGVPHLRSTVRRGPTARVTLNLDRV